MAGKNRIAVIGTGSRAEMFIRAVTDDHADTAELVALADTNQARMDVHNGWLKQPVPTYQAADLERMLAENKVDELIVTSVDSTHAGHIVTALEAGCDVITEKPMTVDAPSCRRILDAVERTGRRVQVAFNYRFNPVHEVVRTLLAGGEIGEIGSVHFEWLLDVRHGADYFRRWHRDKANSGGLLVHKSGHHFDLVNWWLGAKPEEVYASGRLFFYGDRGRGKSLDNNRFALDLAADPRLKALYLDAQNEDGYHRDQDVFAPGVTIEDDLAVLVRYDTGATMTYHLTAYAPWEGYRLMVNGSKGRLELEVIESDHVSPGAAGMVKHGASPESGSVTLTIRPYWTPPYAVELQPVDREGHGGADKRLTGVLLGGQTDPMNRSATARDGALALLTGLAANQSLRDAAPVRVDDLLEKE
ncbi:Gfo/Idh/MocA family protein [Paractinoplanes lichenicola]|uniref:Gfo/Idh/MocA family oxidoreductase n=1 Tax=Paractinoplanes lichenicola TaxID=2802976 RepID=A0ABS1VUU2_9ACTN|nr:Gfo/Idh/MocA family oxidoreductase [Actinoplanes lichenicola]MBL7258228.1 Gfo/Idh/MocA family oxidoreductase [Actinoplanes lichenicola]